MPERDYWPPETDPEHHDYPRWKRLDEATKGEYPSPQLAASRPELVEDYHYFERLGRERDKRIARANPRYAFAKAPEPEPEQVNHPEHYGGDTPYEVIKVIEAWSPAMAYFGCMFNVIKYAARADKKGAPGLDINKASWYAQRATEILQRHPHIEESLVSKGEQEKPIEKLLDDAFSEGGWVRIIQALRSAKIRDDDGDGRLVLAFYGESALVMRGAVEKCTQTMEQG